MRVEMNGTMFLRNLVARVRDGRMQPAAFNRPYRWKRESVLALCESVTQGYPLGGFLTWTPTPDVALRVTRPRLGPIEADGSGQPNQLLLDGQNRLATVAWMMHEPGTALPAGMSPEEEAVWAQGESIVLDMAAKVLRFPPDAEAAAGFFLPSSVLLRPKNLMDIVRDRWDNSWSAQTVDARNEALRWMDACVDAFSEARVTETHLLHATPAQAKTAFAHIARVGEPITPEDFDAALSWSLA